MSYRELVGITVIYDKEKDGCWMEQGGERFAFLPRNVVLALAMELPPDPNRKIH